MLNKISGEIAEMQLAHAMRSRKQFKLSDFFDLHFEGIKTIDDVALNIIDVKLRFPFQRDDGKNMELDIVARASCGAVLLVEVKKRAVKTDIKMVEDFLEKVVAFKTCPIEPDAERVVLPAFLSLGGFTKDALALCGQKGIAVSNKIRYFLGGDLKSI